MDVWALGLTLYELVCQGTKWRGQKTILDRRGRVIDYLLSRMEDVNRDLEASRLNHTADVVQEMLEVDATRRITAKEAFDTLEKYFKLEEYGLESPGPKRQKTN